MIAVVAVWINYNLFFNIKAGNNGIGIGICGYRFTAAVFAVAYGFLKLLPVL